MNNTYEQYAIIKAKIAELTEQADAMVDVILAEMNDAGEQKIETSLGKFSITKLKKWTYPENVLAIGERFKAEKAKAESTGDATFTEMDSLRFTPINL